MSESRREVAADTSFLINLFATHLAVELVDSGRLVLVVVQAVYDEFLDSRVEFETLIASGRARVVKVPNDAIQHYVDAARVADESEAATIALSISLRVSIATDDGCVADYWTKQSETRHLGTMGICDVLKAAEFVLNVEQIRDAIIRVRRDASFAPPSHHVEWWNEVLNRAS